MNHLAGVLTSLTIGSILLFSTESAAQWVESVYPDTNAIGVPLNTDIQVVFNVQIEPASLTNNSVRVTGPVSGVHTGEITYVDSIRTLTFNPDFDFSPGERVNVLLTGGITIPSGDSLSPYSWHFTVSDSGLFIVKSTIGVLSGPHFPAKGDWNGDGFLDLAIPCRWSAAVVILQNDGKGNFAATETVSVGNRPLQIAVGDLNGDGSPDMAVTNWISNTVSILINNGSGKFSVTSTVPVGYLPEGIGIADLDADGDSDLVVTNSGGSTISVLSNDGRGTFVQSASYVVEAGPVIVLPLDIDRDGKIDLIVANYYANSLSILKNSGLGKFVLAQTLAMGGCPASIVTGDWNGDHKMDLAVSNNCTSSITLLAGNDSGAFSFLPPVPILNPGGTIVEIVAGDWDNNGTVDLAAADGDANVISILTNADGLGTFIETGRKGVGTSSTGIIAGDWDRDGDLDLAATNDASNDVTILTNTRVLTGINHSGITTPNDYLLQQNYPNPFNPATKFEYQLPSQSEVRLTIYNVLGQVVSVLVDEVEEIGFKTKEWNASNVSSGVYFYRLEATSTSKFGLSFTQVKKMLVVK